MIPVIEGVYEPFGIAHEPNPKKKIFLQKQVIFLRKHEEHIIGKAKKLYYLKIKGGLYENYDRVTCDFKLLKEKAALYR